MRPALHGMSWTCPSSPPVLFVVRSASWHRSCRPSHIFGTHEHRAWFPPTNPRTRASITPADTTDVLARPSSSANAHDDEILRITEYLASTYGMLDRYWVKSKVEIAAEALQCHLKRDGAPPRPFSLELDILPKAQMLDALSPDLAWKIFTRYPEEFLHPYAEDYWKIMAACLYTAGFSPQAVSALFKRHHSLFARSVQDPANVRSVFEWLRGLGIGQAAIVKIINRHPLLLQTSVADTLQPRLEYMLQSLGIPRSAAGRTIQRQPEILGVRSACLQERADFLIGLGMTKSAVTRLFAVQPGVFTMRIEERLQPIVDILRDDLGCDSDLTRKILAQPGVLNSSAGTIAARIQTWQNVGLDAAALRDALYRFPHLLRYAIDKPKYLKKVRFLTQVLGHPVSKLVVFPQYMSYNFSGRIAPRMMSVYALRGTFPSLQSLAKKDEVFFRTYGLAEDEYAAAFAAWAASDAGREWMEDEH